LAGLIKLFASSTTLLFLVLAHTRLLADDDGPKIPLEEALGLAQEAMKSYRPGAALEYIPGLSTSDFYEFAALSDNPTASPNVGRFAVNARTGDVWDGAGFCTHLTSPSLRKLQRDIRTRFKLPDERYKDLRKQKPMCDAEW
jgi:hypothetical protein